MEVECADPIELWSRLNVKNPCPRSNDIHMMEETHTYICKGRPVRTSATGLLKNHFPCFDGPGIVAKNYDKWKVDKTCKYKPLIDYLTLVEKQDDEFCKRAIVHTWSASGESASAEGTAMHRDFQFIVEGYDPPQGETPEVVQFRAWLARFCKAYELEPWRSEWNIYYETPEGEVLVAGQVDLVLKHRIKDEFWCVDFKRSDPQPKYKGGPEHRMGEEIINRFTEYGTGPLEAIPATDFGKYSCQQNIYGHIAATQYGIDFRDHMYLLQVHRALPKPHIVGVERLDAEMDALFANELRVMRAEAALSDA